jgi:hypothetical protein
MLQGSLLFLFHKSKKISLFLSLVLITLGGMNLQLVIRTQKLLHQWVTTHCSNSGQQTLFTFSNDEWELMSSEEKKEFEKDGVWYDTQDIAKQEYHVQVTAKADKWENIFKQLLPSSDQTTSQHPAIASSHWLWKYLPIGPTALLTKQMDVMTLPKVYWTIQKIHPAYLFSILKPPIDN